MPYKNPEDRRRFERERYRKNPEYFKARAKKWLKEHPNYSAKWRKNHPNYSRRYYEEHREEISARMRKYRQKNKEEISKKKREYYKAHQKECNARKIAGRKVKLKEQCQICGSVENLERHHPDYDQTLNVQTLCGRCHQRLHHRGVDIG